MSFNQCRGEMGLTKVLKRYYGFFNKLFTFVYKKDTFRNFKYFTIDGNIYCIDTHILQVIG